MAKKGTKIKELAREIGVSSQVIVERCRVEGIRVQNSITKLTPHKAQLVRSWFSGQTHHDDAAIEDGTNAE